MRKRRAELRSTPDTILKLIKVLGLKLSSDGVKLTNGEVVARAVAKLAGQYITQKDGTIVYIPKYETCPDCSGLIDPEVYKNPPPNDEQHASEWRNIKKEHVTSCSWLKMALAGDLSVAVEQPKVASTPNVIEMKHNTVEPIKTEIPVQETEVEVPQKVVTEMPIVETVEKPAQVVQPVRKPTLDEIPFEGEEQERYVDKFGKVQVRVKQKVIHDDADFRDMSKVKDEDAMSVTMDMGVVPEEFAGTKRTEVLQRLPEGRQSKQGIATEKPPEDGRVVMKLDVNGEPPPILFDKDKGEVVEKDEDLAKPTRVAKERITKSRHDHTGKTVEAMEFE